MVYKLPLFLIIFLVGGCTFHSAQLEAARSMLNREEVLPEHWWLLQLGESKVPLLQVRSDPPYTTFVNSQGVYIVHNGYDITLVSHWIEGDVEIRISREADLLTYRLTGENGGTIETRCTEWTLVDSLNWHSECQSITGPSWSYRNELHMDEAGRGIRLRYALWPGLSPIDLIWFPVSGESTSILPNVSE